MAAGKQMDVVTAGLIVGNADSHRVLSRPRYLCSTRSLWELALPAMRPASAMKIFWFPCRP